jgi:hypothetical protein
MDGSYGVVLTYKYSTQKKPLPSPEMFDKWLCKDFSNNTSKPIYLLDGSGEIWKKQKARSRIVTAIHPDLTVIQLKTFYRILLLRQIALEHSVDPIVYIMALGDVARGINLGEIKEKVAQTSKFIQQTFSPLTNVKTIVDHSKIRINSILKVIDFDKSLEKILTQMKTPEELERTQFFGEKRTALTSVEKRLLKIYLFERKMLEAESRKYPYISWGLEAQAELGASYNIYDESNAGAAILRKLVSIDKGREYPGTIVLPDPLTVLGVPMRYQVQRDLKAEGTLFVSDSYVEVKNKLVDQEGVSDKYLDFLMQNIIQPFASSAMKKERNLFPSMKIPTTHEAKKQFVLRCYWEFIKPYQSTIERITGLHEGLFIDENLVEEALSALGSNRNRTILQTIAKYYRTHKDGMTTAELSHRMGLAKSQRRGVNRNLRQLAACGLVAVEREGSLGKYYIYGKKTLIQIRWLLLGTYGDLADDEL